MIGKPQDAPVEGDYTFTIRVVDTIGAVSAERWDELAAVATDPAAANTQKATINPFVSYAFLSSLEDSGSVSQAAGWLPQHLVLEGPGGEPIAAAPAYLKSHSQGEYVFDHGWADAFQRAGGRYYPKLQMAVPFTPASGPRLLVGGGAGGATRRMALAEGAKTYAARTGVSSVHATFLRPDDLAAFEDADWLHRTDQQFHFHNRGYDSYDAFLGTLASRKRKALRKERAQALVNDISIEWLTGRDLTEAVWDAFYEFYMDTGSRKWGRPYLNREFFRLVGERMGAQILLVMAKRNGRYIAGGLNFLGPDTVYGRNWGCVEDHPYLHFEVCYHQAIDYAIAHGLTVVEAGAQGEHKLARGYEPVTTHSAHWISHPGLRRAIEDYLDHERAEVARVGEILGGHTPYKKDAS